MWIVKLFLALLIIGPILIWVVNRIPEGGGEIYPPEWDK